MNLMASRKGYTLFSRSITFASILFVLALVFQLCFNRNSWNESHVVRVEGRWKGVRESFGLPALPDRVKFKSSSQAAAFALPARASRFGLRYKRDLELSTHDADAPTQLFFTSDALQDTVMSYEQLSNSFHSIALLEKEMEQNRQKQALRNHRRPG